MKRYSVTKNMRFIFVSGRFLRIENPTGTQRSARRWLMHTLAKFRGAGFVYAPGPADQRLELPIPIRYEIPASAPASHCWEQLSFPRRGQNGVLWTLMGTGPVYKSGNTHVMFVHDLNFMLIPHAFSWKFRAWYWFSSALSARRADKIVCFTNYVKQSLIDRLAIPAEKIAVIPQGPGLDGVEDLPQSNGWNLADPYFLCVGSLQPHKNLITVLAAWENFLKGSSRFKLKVVGRRQAQFTRLSFDPEDLDLPGVEFTGYVNDAELIQLYRGALGFVFPSLEEGFGLPIVEAFYCGCPVITSNVSCLPEVAGDAALLIDPLDANALSSAIQLLATSSAERDRLRFAGYRRAGFFRWAEAGTRMADILKDATQ